MTKIKYDPNTSLGTYSTERLIHEYRTLLEAECEEVFARKMQEQGALTMLRKLEAL